MIFRLREDDEFYREKMRNKIISQLIMEKQSMRKFTLFFTLVSSLFICGCYSSVSNHFIKPDTNLKGYRYVLIQIAHSDVDNIYPFIQKLFLSEGMDVVSENRLNSFSIEQISQTLFCVLSYSGYSYSESRATLQLYNYNEELIYSGEGTFQSEFHTDDTENAKTAVKNSFENFAILYTGFDQKYAADPIKEFKEQFKDWEKINLTEPELKKKIGLISDLNPIEGIWSSIEDKQYRIGIIRDDSRTNRDYVAFILESDNPLWEEKQVKIEFSSTAYKSVFSTTYYLSDHSKQGTTAFINDKGILEIKLKNPEDNSELNATFIKNYPSSNENSFVNIEKESSQTSGTGFIISESGLLVTNWHVVEGSNSIEVFFPELNKSYNATTVIKDSKNDVAILRLTDFSFSKTFNNSIPYPISSSNNIKQGNKVFTLGFPLGNLLGQTSKLSDGIINSLYGIQDDPRLMQISNPIQPGNSGGPLFNSSGEIIGIVVATLNAKYFYENADIIPQNVNFAVKSDYLLNLFSMLPEDKEITQRTNKLKGLSLDKQVEMISPFVVSIRAK